MGSEFLRRTKPTIEKYIHKKQVELATGDLFTRLPTTKGRTALACITSNTALEVGESLVVEASRGSILVTKNGLTIGQFLDPPKQLTEAIKSACGTALGTVIQFNRLSKTAEVSVT